MDSFVPAAERDYRVADPREVVRVRLPLPAVEDVVFLCVFMILTFSVGNALLADGDTGYHIRAGEYILDRLTVPTHDIFSFISPPLSWTVHEWLSEIVMAVVHRAFGLTGIVVFFSLAIALAHLLLYKALREHFGDLILATLVTIMATATTSTHWLARPHIFSLVLTVVWYRLLNDYQYKHKNTLIYLPPLMLLWVNLHGGFMLGLILIGVYFAGNLIAWLVNEESLAAKGRQKAKSLLLVGMFSLAVCLINPQGFHILVFPFKVASDRFLMDSISEFLSPNFHHRLPFLYMLLITVAAIGISRVPLNPIELLLLTLLTYMSLYSARYVALFAVVVSYPLVRVSASLLRSLPPRLCVWYERRNRNLSLVAAKTIPWLWPALDVLLVTLLAGAGALRFEFSDKVFPVAAVKFINQEDVRGRIFSNDEFADYMIYAAWPRRHVFMDGRSDMYGEAVIKEYQKIANAEPDWRAVIEKYNITVVLFNAKSALTSLLSERKDWRPVYADKLAVVFVKTDTNQQVIERHANVQLP